MHKNFGNFGEKFVQFFLKKILTLREFCGIIGANHGSRPDGFRYGYKKTGVTACLNLLKKNQNP